MTSLTSSISAITRNWVSYCYQNASRIIIFCLILTLFAGYYISQNIAINTDTTDMMSEELPFRQADEQSAKLFPQYRNLLVILLEPASDIIGQVNAHGSLRDMGHLLSERLKQDKTHFSTVFYAPDITHFKKNGLLYQSLPELEALQDKLIQAQPFLAKLANSPSLYGISSLFETILSPQALESLSQDEDKQKLMIPVINAMAQTAAQANTSRQAPLDWGKIIGGNSEMLSQRVILLAQPVVNYADISPAGKAIKVLRQHGKDLGLAKNGMRLRITGAPALAYEELKTVESNIGFVGLLSLALVSILLFIGMGSARVAIVTLITLISGLLCTAAIGLFLFSALNLISVAFAVLFVGLGVDFGIHFGLRYKEARQQGQDSLTAIGQAGQGTGFALLLSTLLAAFAFLSFLPTDYDGLSQLGVIAGCGMVVAYLLNITFAPALYRLLPVPAPKHQPAPDGSKTVDMPAVITKTATGSQKAPKLALAVMGIAICLGLVSLYPASQIEFDSDPLNLRDPESESVSAFLDLSQNIQTTPYIAISLAKDRQEARQKAEKFNKLETVSQVRYLDLFVASDQDDKLDVIEGLSFELAPVFNPPTKASQPTISPSTNLENWISQLNNAHQQLPKGDLATAISALYQALTAIDSSKEALARLETLLIGNLTNRLTELETALETEGFERTDLPQILQDRMVSANGIERIEIIPAIDPLQTQSLRSWVKSLQAIDPAVTGAPVVIVEAGYAVIDAFQTAFLISFLGLMLFLFLFFRSLKPVLLVLFPLLLAFSYTLAVMHLLGWSFNFANVIVLPLILGLGVASGLHMVARALQENLALQEGQANEVNHTTKGQALLKTATTRGVIFSGLTTVCSFGSLIISAHRGTASMGEVLTLAIIMTLLSTLVILPALIRLWLPVSRTSESPTG